MSKSSIWTSDLLALLFHNVHAPGIGDATGLRSSIVAGSLFVSLHTADPEESPAGIDQSTCEASYPGYSRVAVPRSMDGWNIEGTIVSNRDRVTFGKCKRGKQTVTHFAFGTEQSGAGKLLYCAALNSPLDVTINILPEFSPGQLRLNERADARKFS